jgi:hypothetical protein
MIQQGVGVADPDLFSGVMEIVTTMVRSEFLPNFLRSQYYQKVVASK